MKFASHDMLRELPRWSVLLGMFAFGQMALVGLAANNAIIPYGVRIWQTDEGLPQNSVYAIAQTSDGFLWVGTHEGLARFDGVRFTVVDADAAPELKQGWITALHAARDGSLWIACDGFGATRLKDGTFTRYAETNGLPNNQTRCFAEGRDGSIWVGTEGGLARWQGDEIKSFTDKSGLPDISIRGICEDQHGIMRVATRRGLSSLTKDGYIGSVNFGLGTVANALKSVCEDRQGNIWVSSNEGVTCESASGRTFYSVSEGLPDKPVG